jgi:hypothetical protein
MSKTRSGTRQLYQRDVDKHVETARNHVFSREASATIKPTSKAGKLRHLSDDHRRDILYCTEYIRSIAPPKEDKAMQIAGWESK